MIFITMWLVVGIGISSFVLGMDYVGASCPPSLRSLETWFLWAVGVLLWPYLLLFIALG